MLVTPLPGTRLPELLNALETQHSRLSTIRGSGGSTQQLFDDYVQWVSFADQSLRNTVRGDHLDGLLLTRRQWVIQSYPPGPYPQGDSALRYLLTTEIDQRILDLADTTRQLRAQAQQFQQQPGRLIVADTSFYIHHPTKLQDAVIADVLGERDTPLHMIVPIAVVDELDGLKHGRDQVRWRAQHTLAVLDRVLPHGRGRGLLRAETVDQSGPRGPVTVEILFDPPGHRRLPITDDEIIDRTLATQVIAQRRITVLTYDTGQSTRARAADLTVVKPPMPAAPGKQATSR